MITILAKRRKLILESMLLIFGKVILLNRLVIFGSGIMSRLQSCPFFFTVAHIVATMPISSAPMERVFGQVKCISWWGEYT